MTRIIAHLDMDAFFAAVEERDRPRLKGRPIVVGADPEEGKGRGIVATANYAARKYGIHSAMPITRAWHASEEAKKRGEPEVIFIQGSHTKYVEVSERIMGIIGAIQYSGVPTSKTKPLFARASIDEAYIDLSHAGSYKKALRLAQGIKNKVWQKERLTCSMGIGPNKLIAKIASDMQKPNGLTVVLPEQVEEFLSPLPIRKVPGIGPKTEKLLNNLGIKIIKDLKKYSQKELADMLGSWGLSLYKKVRGIDNSPVYEELEIKSIGEQETFMQDTLDPSTIFSSLSNMCVNIFNQLRKSGFKSFKTAVITVRFQDFKTVTRSKTLPAPLSDPVDLASTVTQMLLPFLDKRENPKKKLIRLIGVRIEKLIIV